MRAYMHERESQVEHFRLHERKLLPSGLGSACKGTTISVDALHTSTVSGAWRRMRRILTRPSVECKSADARRYCKMFAKAHCTEKTQRRCRRSRNAEEAEMQRHSLRKREGLPRLEEVAAAASCSARSKEGCSLDRLCRRRSPASTKILGIVGVQR